ncbi:MAG TPA: glycosyltransferase [Burkholderiales bacterium]|nr:glycosyltransferase [Burkholderiales bacterium]
MAISFIIPAYNEEVLIGATVRTLRASAAAFGEPYELLVVDDDSSDATADVARAHGAEVLHVKLRQIAAVRNAGARAAKGDLLVFVDADTLVSTEVLRAMRDALARGAVGGGARVRFDAQGIGAGTRWLSEAGCWLLFRMGFAGGCFLFARRDAFEAAGGFDERYFASEEIHLKFALGKRGRFAVVPGAVFTSGRKLRLFTAGQILRQLLRLAMQGLPAVRRREGLEFWYNGRREAADLRPPIDGGSP